MNVRLKPMNHVFIVFPIDKLHKCYFLELLVQYAPHVLLMLLMIIVNNFIVLIDIINTLNI